MIALREAKVKDMENYVKWRNSPGVRNFHVYKELYTLSGQKRWFRENVMKKKAAVYLIYDRQQPDSDGLGFVNIHEIDRQNKKAEFGLFLSPDVKRGSGIGSKASRLALDIAFNELNLHKLYLNAFSDNAIAIKCYENAGFKREGYFEDEVWIDGQFRDMVRMSAKQGLKPFTYVSGDVGGLFGQSGVGVGKA